MNTFFASQNTCRGFVSRFGEIFDESRLERLYIIKGGPGTGKSRLLKMIADKWSADEGKADVFICSSDPDSLDGVTSPSGKFAAVDGTAPHCTDPRYPGAVSRILNTGDFWDEKLLSEASGEIIALNEKKSANFARAYRLLGACGALVAGAGNALREGFDGEKSLRAAKRLAASIGGEKGDVRVRLTSTFNHLGHFRLDSFEKLADTKVLVTDPFGTGSLFMEELFGILKENSVSLAVSYSPLDGRPDSIFVDASRVSVSRDLREDWEKRCGYADKYVNMDRFLDRSQKSALRQKLKFTSKCSESLKNAASEEFAAARERHMKLEEIYGSAMDFKALTDFQNSTVAKL